MVRAPCCEKMGLKKGPWTRDEDLILINHVTLYGHGNWRALPKQAGLLRCGKSCRLRWTNYLSPDIKRGNFSQEEEETIINLHQVLGNRWSAIAAKLPGRTDNEIKNVWHTHLKKRIKNIIQESNAPIILSNNINAEESRNLAPTIPSKSPKQEKIICQPNSPQQQSSSITTATSTVDDNNVSMKADDALTDFLEIDDTFWSEVFSTENSSTASDFVADNSSAGTATSEFSADTDDFDLKFLEFGGYDDDDDNSNFNISSIINMDSGAMDDFWYNMLTNSSGQLPEL